MDAEPPTLVTAVYRVDFDVLRSDRYVVLGPSGCGKSTLLKAVGGYITPIEGRITLNRREIARPGPDRVMVFQRLRHRRSGGARSVSISVLLVGYGAGVALAFGFAVLAMTSRIGNDFLETLTAMFNPLPAAFTSILAGLKIGWAFAWRTLIAAELVFGVSSGQGGLGWFIFENRNLLDIPAVFAGLLTVIIIGLIVENLIFRTIERNTVQKWGTQS